MAKSARKRTKGAIPVKKARKTKKNGKGQTKAAKYVDSLLELHKLQGVLLVHLDKEI